MLRNILIILSAMCAGGLVARAQNSQIVTRDLSTCKMFAQFDESLLVRIPGGQYDTIEYDLNFMEVKRQLILAFDGWGTQIYERNVTVCTPKVLHFSLSERIGNEASLAREINRYLLGQSFFACASAVTCQ